MEKKRSDLCKKEIVKIGDSWKETKESSQKVLKQKEIKFSSENLSLLSYINLLKTIY